MDIIKRSLRIIDELIIGVADNINKTSMFTIAERQKMIESDIKLNFKDVRKTHIKQIKGLLTDLESSSLFIIELAPKSFKNSCWTSFPLNAVTSEPSLESNITAIEPTPPVAPVTMDFVPAIPR